MNKSIYGFIGSVFLFALLAFGITGTSQAEISVNINIGPPPIVVSSPSELVMIPGYGIYFVPGVGYDVFYYNGYWWSPRGDRWYRSSQYNGSWVIVQRSYVPQYLLKVPKNYREVYKNEKHINYGQWKQKFKSNDGGQMKNESQNNESKQMKQQDKQMNEQQGQSNKQPRSNKGGGHKN